MAYRAVIDVREGSSSEHDGVGRASWDAAGPPEGTYGTTTVCGAVVALVPHELVDATDSV